MKRSRVDEDPAAASGDALVTVEETFRSLFRREARPQQVVACQRIDEALRTDTGLIAELPTGTGKTNCVLYGAYRARVVHGRRSIVVSGHTKSLQRQYVGEALRCEDLGRVLPVFGVGTYPCIELVHNAIPSFHGVDGLPEGVATRVVEYFEEHARRMRSLPGLEDELWHCDLETAWIAHAVGVLGLSRTVAGTVWDMVRATPDRCVCHERIVRGGRRSVEELLGVCYCARARMGLLKRTADVVICNISYVCTLAAFDRLGHFYDNEEEGRKVVFFDEVHELPRNAGAIYERVSVPPIVARTATETLGALTAPCRDPTWGAAARVVHQTLGGPVEKVVAFVLARTSTDIADGTLVFRLPGAALRLGGLRLDGAPWARLRGGMDAVHDFLRETRSTVDMLVPPFATEEEVLAGLQAHGYPSPSLDASDGGDRSAFRRAAESTILERACHAFERSHASHDDPSVVVLHAAHHLCGRDVAHDAHGTPLIRVDELGAHVRRLRALMVSCEQTRLAADEDTWRRSERGTQAPYLDVGRQGIIFEPSKQEKAAALASHMLFGTHPQILMSATLRDGAGSFRQTEARLGHGFGSNQLSLRSPFSSTESDRPLYFCCPDQDWNLFPRVAGGGAEDRWLKANAPLMARCIRLCPPDRPLVMVVSKSHDFNRRVCHELGRHLPDWDHYHALDQEAEFEVVVGGDASPPRPTVLYGSARLCTGIDKPGLVGVVVFPKPPNDAMTPGQAFRLPPRDARDPVKQRFWDDYFFSSDSFFRQGCGRIVRTMHDRGIVLFFEGEGANRGRIRREVVPTFFDETVHSNIPPRWPHD